jgi:hypothetical protein
MRRASKTDTTHAEIRETFRQLGWQVIDTSGLGNFVDLVVLSPRGHLAMVEAKTPRKQGGKDRLTDSQDKLQKAGWPLVVLRSAEEAVAYAIARHPSSSETG